MSSMSINQILQPKETLEDQKLTGKVKIFYTFKGSDTHCLCSFDIQLDDYKDKKWVSVPLRQCLQSICYSCPDQLSDCLTAIYSANFEESLTVENWSHLHDAKSNIIWEGHGSLSNILNDENNQTQVTGKVVPSDPATKYKCYIEVLVQLHPIRSNKSIENPTYLPPMRSIWPENNNHRHSQSPPTAETSPRSLSLIQKPFQRDDTPRLPSIDQWSSTNYDSENKRRKVSPPIQQTIPKTVTADTYYHQSRRKKRDTKPPNANDVRPFVEVERRPDGTYVLPAEVDSWTVLNLGTVVWDKAAFHNQRYIYPVGYRVKKWYRSMVDPHSDTQYTCEILDGGDEPIFQLNADDNPSECWRGPTPTTVWTIAVRRAFAIRNMDYGHNPVGPDFFGLRKNTIAKMIQDLPNADKCKNYIWQNFEVMSNNKGKSIRRTNPRMSLPSTISTSQEDHDSPTSSSNE